MVYGKLLVFIFAPAMYSLRFTFDCLIHFLTANSRHGTHSPFVYQLLDEAVYAKGRMPHGKDSVPVGKQGKNAQLLLRLAGRFQPVHILLLGKSQLGPRPHLTSLLPNAEVETNAFKSIEKNLPWDFIVVNEWQHPERVKQYLQSCWEVLHEGTVLVVEGIHRNAGMKALWDAIKAKQKVTVTIDLFHMGLVFFHLGQAKEDFKIRY